MGKTEHTRAIIAFLLLAMSFILIMVLCFVEIPRENNAIINTSVGFILGALTSATGFYFGSSDTEKKINQDKSS